MTAETIAAALGRARERGAAGAGAYCVQQPVQLELPFVPPLLAKPRHARGLAGRDCRSGRAMPARYICENCGATIVGDDPVMIENFELRRENEAALYEQRDALAARVTHLEERVVRRRDRGDVAMNHAAALPAEICRLAQDLEGVLADRDHWREEREREARCQLTRRLAELLRKWGTR